MSLHLLTVVTASFLIAADAEADAKKELDRLQGSWVMVGGSEGDIKLSADDSKKENQELVVKEDTITLRRDGKEVDKWSIKVDPTKKPPAIDLNVIEGREKGKTVHAIYSLKGDELQLRVPKKFRTNAAGERPTEFSTTGKGGGLLFIFKREKK